MSTYTTNYNLEKPDSTDNFKDFRSNYNSNMDIIDANLGGGGGNVNDVLVNGVSVVDGNHDAQITSYKEVTQAQYDALPATKLTDGIAYFIKDAGGGGGGSSSHNYSTTEQVIGTWINSKPLYEITQNIGQLTQDTNFHTIAHGISNIENVFNIKGIMVLSTSPFRSYPLPIYRPTGSQGVLLSVNDTEIQYMNNWQGNAHTVYVTFQYTKTTD